jgi:hypothetical protein
MIYYNGRNTLNTVMEMKLSSTKYFQVFYRACLDHSKMQTNMLVFLDNDINLVLLKLSFIHLTMHIPFRS